MMFVYLAYYVVLCSCSFGPCDAWTSEKERTYGFTCIYQENEFMGDGFLGVGGGKDHCVIHRFNRHTKIGSKTE